MTVVVNPRDDFTLANFRRVSYGGEPGRVGAQARRAMTAGAGHGPAMGSPGREPARRARWPAPGAGFGRGHLDPAVGRGIGFAPLASPVSGQAGTPPSVPQRGAAPPGGPKPVGGLDGLWGDPHETAALRELRRYLEGTGTAGRRFHQAPVSYRIIPRVLGQVHRSAAAVEKAATTSLRSVTSDVVYVSDEAGRPGGRGAGGGGGFHP